MRAGYTTAHSSNNIGPNMLTSMKRRIRMSTRRAPSRLCDSSSRASECGAVRHNRYGNGDGVIAAVEATHEHRQPAAGCADEPHAVHLARMDLRKHVRTQRQRAGTGETHLVVGDRMMLRAAAYIKLGRLLAAVR